MNRFRRIFDLTFRPINATRWLFANSVDQDQTALNVDLHCSMWSFSPRNKNSGKAFFPESTIDVKVSCQLFGGKRLNGRPWFSVLLRAYFRYDFYKGLFKLNL